MLTGFYLQTKDVRVSFLIGSWSYRSIGGYLFYLPIFIGEDSETHRI